mmetsp:Transcript_103882/g.315221  ORF Transcript_103882/g.315221 Transcript_103882/m.315221 type:complete len:399 (-) Transcript_103882:1-1197(-)
MHAQQHLPQQRQDLLHALRLCLGPDSPAVASQHLCQGIRRTQLQGAAHVRPGRRGPKIHAGRVAAPELHTAGPPEDFQLCPSQRLCRLHRRRPGRRPLRGRPSNVGDDAAALPHGWPQPLGAAAALSPGRLAHGAVGAALGVPRLHAAELQADFREEKAVLQHGAYAREAGSGGDEHPGQAKNPMALLHAVGKAALVHEVTELVEHLELCTDRAVDVGVHWQRHGLQPALLPHTQALETVLSQHASLDRRTGTALPFQRSRSLEGEFCVREDATLLRCVVCQLRHAAPTAGKVTRRSTGKARGCTRDEVLIWRGDLGLAEHESGANRAQVVHAHILETTQVNAPAPLVKRLWERVKELLDDAVQLRHKQRVRAGIQADLREECEGLRLHVVELLKRLR